MIIVDTAVWIDHLRNPLPELANLLAEARLAQHSMVTAEIALGSIGPRLEFISLLNRLPPVNIVEHGELLRFIDEGELFGSGIGYVDAHLLAACHAESHQLWTRDKRLQATAERLRLVYPT